MNDPAIGDIWVYLSASPLLGLTITLVAYGLAYRLYLKADSSPLVNPVLTSVVMLILLLVLTGTSYDAYFEGGQFVHFLLGPATVALAVPLYQQLSRLRALWLPIMISLVCGVVIAAGSSIGLAWILGGSTEIQMSLAPKSATAPVAMGISETIGGIPSLTAVLVVITVNDLDEAIATANDTDYRYCGGCATQLPHAGALNQQDTGPQGSLFG